MPEQTVAAAVIYAKDRLRISTFYAAVAGLAVAQAEAGHVVLESEGFQLTVVAVPARIAAAIEVVDRPLRRERTPIKWAHFVPCISAVREQLAPLGGQLNPAEHEWQFHGARVCDGHDREGNVFQLRERAL